MKICIDLTKEELKYLNELLSNVTSYELDTRGIIMDDIDLYNDDEDKISWRMLNLLRVEDKLPVN